MTSYYHTPPAIGEGLTAVNLRKPLGELDAALVVLYGGPTGLWIIQTEVELIISGGVVAATYSRHTIDTESDAATDDLDTITGGIDGQHLEIRAENDARTVVVKHNTGNILLFNGLDITLNEYHQAIMLVYNGALSAWVQIGAGAADSVAMARIGASTFRSVQHMQDIFHSAGWVGGGAVSDAGGETVDIAAGTGLIRATASATAEILFFDWAAATGQAIPTDTVLYIGVEYNAGSPQIAIKTSDTWDLHTDFPLARVVNEATTLHIVKHEHAVGDHASTMIQRMHQTDHISRDDETGGIILGETGTRNVTVTAGRLWNKLNLFSIAAVDTSAADTFDAYYRDGVGGFTKVAAETQWGNDSYDDGTGVLATMIANRFAALYFYIELDGDLVCMYGQAQYVTQAAAEADTPPSSVPVRLDEHGVLIGRIIFRKNDGSATAIESVWATTFGAALVTDHNILSGLQGGTAGEYYHLTSAEYSALGSGGGGGQFVVNNASGGAVVANDVGYLDENGDYVESTTAAENVALCVVVTGGADASDITIARRGKVTVVLDANIAIDDYITTSTTAGQAGVSTVVIPEIFGVALTANVAGAGGTCDVQLLTGMEVRPLASDENLLRIDNFDGTTFAAAINDGGSLDSTTVPYDTVTGDEDSIDVVSATALGNLILHNLTRGNSRLITAVNTATNVITTVASIDDWADNDVITCKSQTNISTPSSKNFYDVEITSVINPLAIGIFIYINSWTDTGSAGNRMFLHPFAANAAGKRQVTYNMAAGVNQAQAAAPLALNQSRFQIYGSGGGANTATMILKLVAEIVKIP